MTDTKSFQSILEEKMAAAESEISTYSTKSTDAKSPPIDGMDFHNTDQSTPAFDLMSQLLGSIKPTFFDNQSSFSVLKTSYKTAAPSDKQTAKKQKASPLPPAPELTVLITQLTAIQKTALEKMISLGATELKGAALLGESRVKKCFRRLAKSFHPDHQSALSSQKAKSSQNFRELRESYNILISAFVKTQKSAA